MSLSSISTSYSYKNHTINTNAGFRKIKDVLSAAFVDKDEKRTVSAYVYTGLKGRCFQLSAPIVQTASAEAALADKNKSRYLGPASLFWDGCLIINAGFQLINLSLAVAVTAVKLLVDIFAGGFIYETKKQWAKAVALDLALLLSAPLMAVALCLVIGAKVVWDVLCFLPRLILGIPCLSSKPFQLCCTLTRFMFRIASLPTPEFLKLCYTLMLMPKKNKTEV